MFHGDVSCVTKCVDIFSWIEPAWVPEAKMILRNKWLQKTHGLHVSAGLLNKE